jgi:hypothetical protein
LCIIFVPLWRFMFTQIHFQVVCISSLLFSSKIKISMNPKTENEAVSIYASFKWKIVV